MLPSSIFVSLGLALMPRANAQEVSTMGPAAFLWPPDREYSAAWDNRAPCGTSTGVGNRTQFPLTNGAVAIVLQDESYSVNIAISYSNDPLSNSDFSTLVPGTDFPEIEPGHECYSVPNPPSSIVAGANATLQLSYTSSFDTSTNQTYYACADIRYVALSDFTTSIPCFNVTEDTPYTTSAAGVASTATSSSSSSSLSSSSSSHSGLSRGAIAGIVVGSIVGAAMLAALLFLLYRAHVRKLRRDIVVQLRMHDLTNAHKPMTAPSDTSGEHH